MSDLPKDAPTRKTLNLRRHIIGAPVERPVTAVRRRLADYPQVSRAHRDVAAVLSSPLLMGPPLCPKEQVVTMEPVPERRGSPGSFLGLVTRNVPMALAGALRAWWRR